MVIGYRIVIADNDQATFSQLSTSVTRVGHRVVYHARSGQDLADLSENAGLDVIITNVRLPGIDGLTAAKSVTDKRDVPVIAFSAFVDDLTFELNYAIPVFAYLMTPVREPELLAAIPLAIRRFQEFRSLRDEASNMQKALEERKLVERAKGILMRRQTLDEATAFLHLQKLARNHRLKMGEVAKSIILAEEALEGPAIRHNSPDRSPPLSLASRRQRR